MVQKPKPGNYADLIDLPDEPGPEAVKVEPRTRTARFEPDPAPMVEAEAAPVEQPMKVAKPRTAKVEAAKPASPRKASAALSRREAARLRRQEPKPEPADYAQRSLYARDETFERFRKLAFENGVAAQQLYREGLFLVLEKYGKLDGLTLDDM